MVHGTGETRLRHRRSLKARQLPNEDPDFGNLSGNDGNDVSNQTTDDSPFDSTANDPTADNNTDDTSGGSDNALQQLLSSQAAQFSATAFSNIPTQTAAGLLQPTDTSGLDDSSDSASVSLSPTSTTQPLLVPTTTPSATMSANDSVITALPTVSAATPSSASSSSSSGSSHKSSHSAAVGVTVTFLIIGMCVAAFWFVRKRQMAKRESRRMTWNPPLFNNNGVMDSHGNGGLGGDMAGKFENIDINEKQGPTALPDNLNYHSVVPGSSPPLPASVLAMPIAPPPLHPTGYAPPRMPSPPPIATTAVDYTRHVASPVGMDAPSFMGGTTPLVSSTQFAAVVPVPVPVPVGVPRESLRSSASSPGAGLGLPVLLSAGSLVIVARTFVPSLPDELPIQTGEQVRIVTRYDDGWAHVERMKSGAGVESGVVPLECLDAYHAHNGAVPGMGLSQIAVEGWRLSKRDSSLRGVDSPVQRV